MSKLNEKNELTEKIIHLMVNNVCLRNCPYCCNKQYSVKDIPVATEEELSKAHTICITGGEPTLTTNPCKIAKCLKKKYKNIKNVYLYSNAFELTIFLKNRRNRRILHYLDGITVSIKNEQDVICFNFFVCPCVKKLKSNIVYYFNDDFKDNLNCTSGFTFKKRSWQEDFTPANDSIFRRMKGMLENE